eukprot:scaffold4694_cov124-Pinguiococcus_pyrenoidosus.AAC.1
MGYPSVAPYPSVVPYPSVAPYPSACPSGMDDSCGGSAEGSRISRPDQTGGLRLEWQTQTQTQTAPPHPADRWEKKAADDRDCGRRVCLLVLGGGVRAAL